MAVKKLSAKLGRGKKKSLAQASQTRITNDTVAEHREKILSDGRRYKYPLQYARHKLVANAIAIAMAALVILLALGYWQLYIAQNSNAFFYRITKLAPLPIASVDGEMARYSDYLVNYRVAEHYLSKFDEISPESEDGKLQLRYKQRESLDIAVADAYARKLAGQHGLSISDEQVKAVLDGMRSAANGQLTEETSAASSQRVLGLSPEDLRYLVKNSLLRTAAAFEIDDQAKQTVEQVNDQLAKNDEDFEKTAKIINKQSPDSVVLGSSGLVNISTNFGGIRARDIAELEAGKVSEPIKSITTDGYYFVKLLERTDSKVSFAYLHIPLTKFDQDLKKLRDEGKIQEYISIDLPQKSAPRQQGD